MSTDRDSDAYYAARQAQLIPTTLANIQLPGQIQGVRSGDTEGGYDTLYYGQNTPEEGYLAALRSAGYMPASSINWDAPFQQKQGDYNVPFSGTVRDAYKLMYPQMQTITDPTHGDLLQLGPYQNTGIDYYNGAASDSGWDKFMGNGGSLAIVGGVAGLANLAGYGALAGTEGAAGAGGNILDGMDLSSYLTNFDTFNPSMLTSAAEGGAGAGAGGLADGFGDLSIYNDAAVGPEGFGTTPGMTTITGVGGGSPAGNSGLDALTRILKGDGGLADWLNVGGKIGPSLIGAYSANKQADAYGEQMDKYFSLGAPYRDLLQKSYQPGFDLENEPGFKNSMDVGLNTFMRAASAGRASGVSRGNPWDSPGAMMEAQKYLTGSLAMPYLTNYRSGLSGAGQLGLGPSADFGAASIKAQGGMWGDLGVGLSSLLNPKPDYGIVIDGNGGYRIPDWSHGKWPTSGGI